MKAGWKFALQSLGPKLTYITYCWLLHNKLYVAFQTPYTYSLDSRVPRMLVGRLHYHFSKTNFMQSCAWTWTMHKGGFESEDTGEFLLLLDKYFKSLSWAENLNKLFIVLGGKFKFSFQDSNLEYLSWRSKNLPVSSDLKPPLAKL